MILLMQFDAAVDCRLHDNSTRVRFVGVVAKLKILAQAGRHFRQVILRSEYRGESAGTLDTLFPGGEVRFGQDCGQVTVSCGMTGVKRLCHRAKHFSNSRCLRCCQSHGPDHLLSGKVEELSDRGCGSKHSSGCGDVPAGLVVRRVYRISDPRLCFESHDVGVEEVFSGGAIGARISQQSRCDWRRRVDVVLRHRIVVFEHVSADAVDNGREKRIEALAPRQQLRRSLAGERSQGPYGRFDGRLAAAAHGASNEIEQRALGFVYNIAGNLFEPAGYNVRRQCFGFRHDA